MTLHRQAAKIASKGRKGDSVLVHMTPNEVAGLNGLALSLYGKPLTVNPKTGLVEANLLKQWIGPIVGAVAGGMGWSSTTASILGGIANGLTNGFTLRNVGLGALSANLTQDAVKDLNTSAAAAKVPAPAASSAPAIGPAPATKPTTAYEDVGVNHTPATVQAAQTTAAANQQVAATKPVTPTAPQAATTPPSTLDKFKTLGSNAIKTFNDPKASQAFIDSHKLQILAAAAAASATKPRAEKTNEEPMQRWESNWEPGIFNPNYGKFAGEPYYLPGTRGYKNGHWTTTPYGTVAPTDPTAYVANPEAYRFLHPIAAAKGGYLASGGAVPTEQPVKEAPVVPTAAAPPTPDPRLTYTSPYSGKAYKSPYADDLAAYLTKLNTSLHPLAQAATGTGTSTAPPTGGGSGTASGGGSNPGSTPAGAAPPTTTVGGDAGSYTGTGTGSSIGVVGPPGTTVPVSYGPGSSPAVTLPDGIFSDGANTIGGAVNAAIPFGGWSGNSGTALTGPLSNALNNAATGSPQGPLANQINAALPTFPVDTNPTSSTDSTVSNWYNNITNNPVSDTFKTLFELPTTAIDGVANQIGKTLSLSDKNLELLKTALNLGVQGPTWAISHIKRLLAQFKKAKEDEKSQQTNPPATTTNSGAQVTTGGGGLGLGGGFNGSGGGVGSWGGIQLPPGSVTVEDVPGAYGAPGKAAGGIIGRYAAGGGIASLGSYSDGGRFLKGPGDGVSDDIPATIDHPDGKQQPARLATGEFVFPARIVSEIGNGSSDAGAQKLYAIMDKIQNDRKRTLKNVATDTNAERHFNGLMA